MPGPSQVTVDIQTQSTTIPKWNTPAQPPTITLNGNAFPQPQGPASATGFQLVVLDSSKDMTDPGSVRFNSYMGVYPDSNGYWYDTYNWMWNSVVKQLLLAGDPDSQLVFLASYGLDANMPPGVQALQKLLNIGAGAGVQQWEKSSDPGSESTWTAFPACYILIGGSSYQYGEGHEVYQKPTGTTPVTANLSVTLGNP